MTTALRDATELARLIWEHPANQGRRCRSLAKFAGWQIWKRCVKKPFSLTIHQGIRVRCFPDSHEAGRVIYFNGRPDPAEMAFTERFLRHGDRYIDAGANIGVYTLLAAQLVGQAGSVTAFEPDLQSFSRLKENVAQNNLSNVTLRRAAVAAAKGSAEFTMDVDAGNSLAYLAPDAVRKQTVELTTLDSELSGGNYVMCKMDVEGAEFRALSGATTLLQAGNPPVWQLELTNRTLARGGSSVDQVKAFLSGFGYDLWSYAYKTNELRPWVLASRRPGQVGDALAIHRSALEHVRRRIEEQ